MHDDLFLNLLMAILGGAGQKAQCPAFKVEPLESMSGGHARKRTISTSGTKFRISGHSEQCYHRNYIEFILHLRNDWHLIRQAASIFHRGPMQEPFGWLHFPN